MVPPCAHHEQPEPVDVTGTGASRTGPRLDGNGGNSRKPRNLAHAREVMGIDWMTRPELSEAIPPAFTEWIGERLMAEVMEHAQCVVTPTEQRIARLRMALAEIARGGPKGTVERVARDALAVDDLEEAL